MRGKREGEGIMDVKGKEEESQKRKRERERGGVKNKSNVTL